MAAEHLTLIATVSAAHVMALIIPGPDFAMCVRNSLAYSRRAGIWTSVGFGAGIAIHIFYSLAGLALVISQSPKLFSIIKLLSAGYLITIGIRSLFMGISKSATENKPAERFLTPWAALRLGFLTNVLNPKATLFFLSLFTLVISPNTPTAVMAILIFIMIGSTILWFSLVATFLTQPRIKSRFESFQGSLVKLMGTVFITLGARALFW